jgi:hypothetical protein
MATGYKKKILDHAGVKEIVSEWGTEGQYKYEVMLHNGYRFEGYETHSKLIKTYKEGADILFTIERCPTNCHCNHAT